LNRLQKEILHMIGVMKPQEVLQQAEFDHLPDSSLSPSISYIFKKINNMGI